MMINSNSQTKNSLLYFTGLIGLGFFWMGAAYIVQAYRLLELMDGGTVNLLVCGLYYVCQALGIGGVALLFIKHASIAGGQALPFWSTLLALVTTALSLFTSILSVIIISGAILNIAIGIISACYLTRLATNVPQQRRGLVFGAAYAFGSIGTWLLSLLMDGRFLWNDASIFGVIFLSSLSLLLLRRLPLPPVIETRGPLKHRINIKLICLAAGVLFLLSLENTLGFAFPLQGAGDTVYIEFTRAFYGVGLIIAGLVSDKNRRWGAICCISALAFPFAALALGNSVAGETFMWILAYIFLGFWSVYRILVFSDISSKSGMPAFAVLGLMFGRLGEAVGTLGSSLFTGTSLILISGAMFGLVIMLFFLLYQQLYNFIISPEEAEKQLQGQYVNRFGMSVREQEVFSLIIQGMSNVEIATTLYITESTVKFHISNIFKKTGFQSRLGLIADYKINNHL